MPAWTMLPGTKAVIAGRKTLFTLIGDGDPMNRIRTTK